MPIFPARKREYVVVSVGGSLFVPGDIDTEFLTTFRRTILSLVEKGFSFAIVTGGGKTARKYQAAGVEVANLSTLERDWVGIYVNNMHAEFFRIIFGKDAALSIVTDFSAHIPHSHPVVLVGAEAPGHSSDFDAVMVAKKLGAKKVINLSNIDYVYTADPKVDPNAQIIEKISWSEFRNIIPKTWEAGLSSPFDPLAAEEAEKLHLEVAIINGKKLDEFEHYLNEESFIGSVIS